MSDVACVGIAVLDLVFQVDTLPTTPGKSRASRRTEIGGGVAANAAATVAKLGGEALFFGAVGDDHTGDRILAGLDEVGVATGAVRRVAGEASPLSAVLVEHGGERMIVNHAGDDLFARAAPVASREIAAADVVLADMRWPQGAIPALRSAVRTGKPAIVDCDHDPADAPGILEAASHIVFAAETLRRYAGAHDLATALRAAEDRTGAWVAATDGAAGVTWLADGEHRYGPADVVTVVDTLGAGDVFHGAFALAVAEGKLPAAALRWASAAAALKCTRFGGRAGIPTRREVDDFVKERGPWS